MKSQNDGVIKLEVSSFKVVWFPESVRIVVGPLEGKVKF